MQLTITIPDAVAARIFDALAKRFLYNPATDGTKAQFAKAVLIRYIKDMVKATEREAIYQTAEQQAREAVASADTDLSLT